MDLHVSTQPNDRELLRAMQRERGVVHVAPDKTLGAGGDAGAFFSSTRFRRYVEGYRWGVYLTATQRARVGQGFTAVAFGGGEGWRERLDAELAGRFEWYAELCEEAEAQRPTIPRCFAQYDRGDRRCNGGVVALHPEPPCAWRGACARVEQFCRAAEVPRERVLRDKTAEALAAFASSLPDVPPMPEADLPAALARVRAGVRPKHEPALGAGRKIWTLVSEAQSMREERLMTLAVEIVESLVYRTGVHFAADRSLAGHGDLFFSPRVPRAKRGGREEVRTRVYVFAKNGRWGGPSPSPLDTRFLRLTLRPRLMVIDAEIGCSDLAEPLQASFGGRTQPAQHPFLTLIRLDDEAHDPPVLVEALTQLVLSGAVKLGEPTNKPERPAA